MADQKIRQLEVAQIDANPGQPRKNFPHEHIQNLAASIRQHGLMQPIVVAPVKIGGRDKTRYLIVAGECRWRAHKELGWQHIRAIVQTGLTNHSLALQSIVENLQRADLKPIEEARAFQNLLNNGWSKTELAKALGVVPFRIEWRVNLLRLDADLQQLVDGGQLPPLHALEISKLQPSDQRRIVGRYQTGLRTISEIKSAVAALLDSSNQSELLDTLGGDLPPPASGEELATVSAMETRIERLARWAAAGWQNGECVIASRIARDRAALMADKINAIGKGLRVMEKELRASAAQIDLLSTRSKAAAAGAKDSHAGPPTQNKGHANPNTPQYIV